MSSRRVLLAIGLAFAVMGCGERVDVVVVTPNSPDGPFGTVLRGATGRFYEDGKLFAYLTAPGRQPERVDVTAHAVRLPLAPTTTMHVVNPWAAVHDDPYAGDRGRERIAFGKKIEVVSSLPMLGRNALLLVEASKPVGFVRKSDVSEQPPVAKELARAGKASLLEKDLDSARVFGEAAVAADKRDVAARRLAGAMLNHAGDTSGWALWTSSLPPEAPVDVPPASAAAVGPAWVTGANVSLRKKPSTSSSRLATLETGARVNITAIDGDWAQVERATAPPRRLVIKWDDVVDGGDPWRGSTSVAEGGLNEAVQQGFVVVKLLSSSAPDPLALKALGLQRIASGDFDRAVVPLSRALSLRPTDDDVRNALFRAAVETERYTLALQTLQRPAMTTSGDRIELLRVLGCFGDVDKARDHITDVARTGVSLLPPSWSASEAGAFDGAQRFTFTDGSMSFPAGESACLVDDEPHAACMDAPEVHDEQTFAGAYCGHDVEITPEIHARFLAYEPLAKQAVAEHAKLWPEYLASYEAWSAKRDAQLSPRAIVVRLQSDRDQPARMLGLYRFQWDKSYWCGDIQTCTRSNFEMRVVHVPAMQANTPHELWVEGANMGLAWGAVALTSTDDGAAFAKAAVEDPSRLDGARDDGDIKLADECGLVPAAWRDRAAEAGSGANPCAENNGCCGC